MRMIERTGLLTLAGLLAACGSAQRTAPRTDVRPAVVSAAAPRDTLPPAPATPRDMFLVPVATSDSIDGALHQAIDSVTRTLGAAEQLFGDAPSAAADEATWDIEVRSYLTHDRVEFYVQRFTGNARDRIRAWMQRGMRYEPMIRSTFRAAGIPEDMYYLGLVESGYDPHAYSRAAAVGIWQFMTATARGMGLRVDWWVDERRDPMRSTQAAARFLGALRDQFGSLYLAAAAYNGGPGTVARGLTRYANTIGDSDGEDRFFALASTRALRAETSNYVPQLIAAAAIGKEPARYGFSFDPVAPYAYDSVRVPGSTPLAAVASAAHVTLDDVKEHNPHLLRGMTPPGADFWARVPAGTTTGFESAFAALDSGARRALSTQKAKKGATVASMAKAAGITVTQLRWYNPKLKGTKVALGTLVSIPTREVVRGALSVPDPAIERYGTSANGVHVVRRGETLSHIAKRYGTTVSRLIQLNHLKKGVIYAGQSIIVRGSVARRSSAGSVAKGSAGTPRATGTPPSSPKR